MSGQDSNPSLRSLSFSILWALMRQWQRREEGQAKMLCGVRVRRGGLPGGI